MKKIKTGLSLLDNLLGCIAENEFMLVGAGTGIGKTTLANCIIRAIASQGAYPALFSLENTKGDTRTRIAFDLWRAETREWDYPARLWKIEVQNGERDEYLVRAQELMKGFKLVEPSGTVPSIADIERLYGECAREGVDIIILDHLDYVRQEDGNMVMHTNKLVETIKKMVEFTGVPCIAFSHLAKVIDPKKLVPSLSDFYGSSNKTKVCTSAVVISRCYQRCEQTNLKPTYVVLRKDRYGNNTNHGGIMKYNTHTNAYEEDYVPIYASTFGDTVEEI